MAAASHERKVNGNICPVMKNFELSMINHLPLENHGMGVSFNSENNLWNNFANHNIQDTGKQVSPVHGLQVLLQVLLSS